MVKELIDSDSLKAMEDSQLLKVKNELSLNIMTQFPTSGPLKEEIKDMILSKIQKQVIPNFIEPYQLRPSLYNRFIPQDRS